MNSNMNSIYQFFVVEQIEIFGKGLWLTFFENAILIRKKFAFVQEACWTISWLMAASWKKPMTASNKRDNNVVNSNVLQHNLDPMKHRSFGPCSYVPMIGL